MGETIRLNQKVPGIYARFLLPLAVSFLTPYHSLIGYLPEESWVSTSVLTCSGLPKVLFTWTPVRRFQSLESLLKGRKQLWQLETRRQNWSFPMSSWREEEFLTWWAGLWANLWTHVSGSIQPTFAFSEVWVSALTSCLYKLLTPSLCCHTQPRPLSPLMSLAPPASNMGTYVLAMGTFCGKCSLLDLSTSSFFSGKWGKTPNCFFPGHS